MNNKTFNASLGLILCISVCINGQAPQVIFSKIGQLMPTTGVIHVVIDFPLSDLRNECVKTDKYIKETIARHPKAGRGTIEIAKQDLHVVCRTADLISGAMDRTKRDIFSTITGIFGSIFGVLSMTAVSSLSTTVDQIDKIQDNTILQLSREDTRIGQLENVTQQLTNYVSDVLNQQLSATEMKVWQLEMAARTNWLHGQARELEDGITHLITTHRVPLALLNTDRLSAIWEKFEAQLVKQGGDATTTPLKSPLDLLQIPTSFIVTKSGVLRIMIHVPTVARPLVLFQYVPMPIPLRTDKNIAMFELHDPEDKDVLATDPQQSSQHLEMNINSLNRDCWRLGRDYICEGIHVFHREAKRSCLKALFSGRIVESTNLCNARITVKDWAVEQLHDESFVTFTRERQAAQVVCDNGTISTVWLQGYQTWTMNTCKMSTDMFLLSPAQHRGEVVERMSYTLDGRMPELLAGLEEEEIVEIHEHLEEIHQQGKRTTQHMQELIADAKQKTHFRWTRVFIWVGLGIAITFSVGISLFLAFLYVRAKDTERVPNKSST